LNVATNAAPN